MHTKLQPESILTNARIYTLDPDQHIVESLAIQNSRIVAIGSKDEILSLRTAQTKEFNLQDQTVLPGLIDAHIHLEKYALGFLRIDCETPTRIECLDRIRKEVETTKPGDWILGHGSRYRP